MSEFWSVATSMPLVVFTVLLAIVLVYWLLAIVGAVDVGGGADALDGVLDGLGDGADGVLDGMDLDGGGGSGGPFASFLSGLGLGTVPVTIVFSLLIILSWPMMGWGIQRVREWDLASGVAQGATVGVMVVSLAIAMVITTFAARPLAKLYNYTPGQQRSAFVGRTCIVKTQRVDTEFGQGECVDAEGGTVLLAIRSAEDNDLTLGSTALIYDYDADEEVFLVTDQVNKLP